MATAANPFAPKKAERANPRPAPLRHPAEIPRGPLLYARIRKPQHVGGPGDPPPGFVTNTTSASEWVWYWASMHVLDPGRDPRTPPFFGGQLWSYQAQELSRIPGVKAKSVSTNIDFLYYLGFPGIAVRLQSYRYHEDVDAIKQAHDRTQALRIAGQFDILDIYEENYLADSSGAAAIVLLKETLGMVRRQNPLTAGTAMLTRPGGLSL